MQREGLPCESPAHASETSVIGRLARAVETHRLTHGWSKDELCQIANVESKCLRSLEDQDADVLIEDILRLARALDLDLVALLQ